MIQVRLARVEEAPRLCEIEYSGDQAYRGSDLAWFADAEPPPADHYRPHIAAGTVWVAVDDQDRPIAFAAAGVHDDGVVLYQLSTALEHQRKGLGAALLQTVVDWADHGGHPRVMLTTNRDVAWNEPWYRRHGFVEPPHGEATASLAHMLAHEGERGHDPARRVGLVLTLA